MQHFYCLFYCILSMFNDVVVVECAYSNSSILKKNDYGMTWILRAHSCVVAYMSDLHFIKFC